MSVDVSTPPVAVAVISSHPIQYQVPWFTALSQRPEISLEVYYALLPGPDEQGEGFGVSFSWDLPLLEGYRWKRLSTASRNPSLHGFFSSRVEGLKALLRRDRPDAVLITGWHCVALLQALWACIRLGIPCIVRGESNAMRSRPWWKRLAHRTLLRSYDHFLAIGESNRDFYLGHGVPSRRISRCPYFVDNDRFRSEIEASPETRRTIRDSWSIPSDAACFLFAGKLIPKKRPLDLLDALRLARDSDSLVHALIVGDGELLAECRRIARRDDLPVTFAGFLNQSEIARAYFASDCLVLPSDYGETWGLVVNEAMACGRPAIVSDRVGCGPDLVENGSTGFVFPFGDVQALADMLIAAATDRDSLARMGERGRDRVLTGYSVERAVEGTLRAVRTVLAERKSDGRGPWSAPGSAKGGE